MKMRTLFKRTTAIVLSAILIFGTDIAPVWAEEIIEDEAAISQVSDDILIEESGDFDPELEDIEQEDIFGQDEVTDDADIDGKTDVTVDRPIEDMTEEDAVDDYVPADGASGMEILPLGEKVEGTSSMNPDGRVRYYYMFDIEEKGYIQPYFHVKSTDPNPKGTIKIIPYQEYAKGDLESHPEYSVFTYDNPKKQEFTDLGRVGLKPGTYFVEISLARCNGYAVQIDFTASDYYEEEIDSPTSSKKITLGKHYYYGESSLDYGDNADYYHFNLASKAKLTVTAESFDNYYLSVGIYRDPECTEANQVGGKYKTGKDIKYSVTLNPGTYYVMAQNGLPKTSHMGYKFMITGGKSVKETGTATMGGVEYGSLGFALKNMNEEKDYTVNLDSDMVGESNLVIPKKPTSVTINGNGHTVTIIGSKLTSNTDLILNDVTIKTVNKKGNSAKLTLTAKKNLQVGYDVKLDSSASTVKVSSELSISGTFNAKNVTAGTLTLGGEINVNKGDKVIVKNRLNGVNGSFVLGEGFNKPIELKGIAEGTVYFRGSKQADGVQIIKTNQKKISADTLQSVFNVTGITDNEVLTHLYYLKKGKACIFGDAIEYNGKSYGLWKDVVASINADEKSGVRDFNVFLWGDVNVKGPLTMPKKGYDSLTIDTVGEHTITFTGNIKLTGNTTIKNGVTLRKINNKGAQVSGKVTKGKYIYDGPLTF